MRIIYIHQYFNTPDDSSGTRSYEFARRLVLAGHEVHVITSARKNSRGHGWRMDEREGIFVHRLVVPYSNQMSFARRIVAFFTFAVRASTRSRSLKGDLVFATSTPLTVAIPAIFAKWGRKIPMVFEVRDLWPELPIAMGALKGRLPIATARWLEKVAYRNAVHVIALSDGMKKGVVAAGTPADQVTVLPNGCDLDLFAVREGAISAWREAHPELEERQLITYAGTLGAINFVDYLVEMSAYTKVSDPSIAFVIVGSGARQSYVRERAEELGVLGENIFMYERIPKTDVAALLAASVAGTSLFAPVKAMEANSANKFFDALAAGKPVLINYSGWHKALIEENEIGLHLDPRDPESGANEIVRFLADPERVSRYSNNSRRLARDQFDRNDLAARFINVLEDAFEAHGNKR